MINRVYKIFLFSMGLLTFAGCGDDPVTDNTILTLIKGDLYKQSVSNDANTALDSLNKYLDQFPQLQTLLHGTTDLTLFAPSNKAFADLTALGGFRDPEQVNPEIMKAILAFHIAGGKKMKADLTSGVSLPTESNAETIIVNSDGTLKSGIQSKNVIIVASDQVASNGVAHITSSVLIPPSINTELSVVVGTLGGAIYLGKDFTYMAYMISRADADITNPSLRFQRFLAANGTNTLLAISNSAFEKAYNQANGLAAANVPTATQVKGFIDTKWTKGQDGTATSILRNHVLVGKYSVNTVSGATKFTGGNLPAYSGSELIVNVGVASSQCQCPSGVIVGIQKSGGSLDYARTSIQKADITSGISNGIMHVGDGILMP